MLPVKGKLGKYFEMASCQATFRNISRVVSVRRTYLQLSFLSWKIISVPVSDGQDMKNTQHRAPSGLKVSCFPTELTHGELGRQF